MSSDSTRRRSLVLWYAVVPLVTAGILFGVLAAAGVLDGAGNPKVVYDDFGGIVFAPEIDQSQAVWWMWLGGSSAAVVNLGPFFESESGYTVRRWTLTVHSDGPEPLLCFQGIIDVDSSDPIALDAETYSVLVQPYSGLLWRDVLDAEQIKGDVGGLN